MTKVVINNCYGGFSISHACAQLMAELGDDEAKDLLQIDDNGGDEDEYWYGDWRGDRHDPILVEAVEKLQDAASGDCASLVIVTIDCDRYIIKEYDGLEGVDTPEDINWIVV